MNMNIIFCKLFTYCCVQSIQPLYCSTVRCTVVPTNNELMLKIRPPICFRMVGTTARMNKKGAIS